MSLKCSIQIIACIVYRQDFNQILERYIQVRNAACVGFLDNFLLVCWLEESKSIMCRFWRDGLSFSFNKDKNVIGHYVLN